jgi:Holliday junction resolvase RusA-like endonuclease
MWVHGLPAPQGSHKAILDRRGHPQIADGGTAKTRREHRQWRKAVTAEAKAWLELRPGWQPLDEPLKIRILFVMPAPATDKYRTRHAVSPDVDKLIRSVLDSLTDSQLIVDDSRFFAVDAQSMYARRGEALGARLRITRHGAEELADRERLKLEAREGRRRHH